MRVIRKFLFSLGTMVLLGTQLFGQASEKLSYQAVMRNSSNVLLANKSIGMKISILQGNATGAAVYIETQTQMTNLNGIVSLEIGSGTILSGTIGGINWSKGPFFIKTEADPLGGSNYTITGTTQLLSVPYALYAGNGVKPGSLLGQMTYWTGTAWDFVNPGSEGQILTLRNGVPIWSATSPTVFTASAASSSICAGDRTTLTASGAISYVWSPATGLSSTTISNPIANPAVTTTYYVTGTSGSHSSTVNVTVTVTTTKPVVTATATTPTICAGDWTTLTANGATSYVWSPVTGLNSTTIPNPTANPKVTTTYTVTGSTGSCSSAPVNVTVTVTPLLAIVPPSFSMVSIPGGTFTMGSPETEVNRIIYETQHEVTLSAFKMSKYEITNAQYALFLNTKKIGSNGKYEAGTYPTQTLIYATDDGTVDDWGLIYNGCQWVPLAGFENHPVVDVTWYGAYEFGLYAGGRLPTEAEWEYACRGNTTTAFNTGNCLSNLQANYNWSRPQTGCTNSPAYLNKTQAVGSYGANAFGLHDMHGNVIEWCSDWNSESTPPSQQTNPTGPTTGIYRLCRGGSWFGGASSCRSAALCSQAPSWHSYMYGFRLVFVP